MSAPIHRNKGHRNKGHRNKGFTLLEIIVALAILSMTMGVVLQLVRSSVDLAVGTDEFNRATSIARSQLERFIGEPRLVRNSQGEQSEFRWVLSSRTMPGSRALQSDRVQAWLLEVEVSWGRGARQRSVQSRAVRLVAREALR